MTILICGYSRLICAAAERPFSRFSVCMSIRIRSICRCRHSSGARFASGMDTASAKRGRVSTVICPDACSTRRRRPDSPPPS